MTAILNQIFLADGIIQKKGDNFSHQYYASILAQDLKLSRWCLENASRHNIARFERIAAKLASFDSIAHCVFDTYEILEMILLRLPMRDMLVASRVNKTFNAITRRSLSIQRALCLVPGPVRASQLKHHCRDFVLVRTSKVQQGPWKLASYNVEAAIDEESDGKTRYDLVLKYELRANFCRRFKSLELRDIRYPQGSWRAMLLTRPLCDRVRVRLSTKGGKCVIDNTVIEHGAVTMGEVQDWLQTTYTATVASEDWRLYVDAKDTFR